MGLPPYNPQQYAIPQQQSSFHQQSEQPPLHSTPQPPLASPFDKEWQDMKNTLKDLQLGTQKKHYKFEVKTYVPIRLRNMTTIPFPQHFEVPKFDKYKGKGDPRDHIKEFFMACQEVSHDDQFLLRLFP